MYWEIIKVREKSEKAVAVVSARRAVFMRLQAQNSNAPRHPAVYYYKSVFCETNLLCLVFYLLPIIPSDKRKHHL